MSTPTEQELAWYGSELDPTPHHAKEEPGPGLTIYHIVPGATTLLLLGAAIWLSVHIWG